MAFQEIKYRPAWISFWYAWPFFWLIVPLLYILYKRYSMTLTVKEDEVALDIGLFTRNSTEVKIRDIKTIEVHQTIVQRMLGYGQLRLATAGTGGWEVTANGLDNPVEIREVIQRLRGDQNV